MTTQADLDFVPFATEMLAEFGIDGALAVDALTYSPITGDTTVGSTANQTVKVVPALPYDKALMDGDVVITGAYVTYFAGEGLTLTPVQGMTITVKGEIWRVIELKSYDSGDETALWEARMVK